jgi:DNA primase
MYYSDEIIEEVRSRNNILDVVNSYVPMKKKGANYWGLCPFHNEKTPSFSVNVNKQIYHCFGCGEGGNVFSFVMKYENLTFPEAVQQLAGRAGITLPEPERTEEEKARANKRARLLGVNKEAATYFFHMLRTPHGEKGMKYLTGRGLTEETIRHFGLGFAGVNGREVVDYLRSKGYTDEEIRDSGIANFNEKYGLTSQFWNRVMYPIQDSNHRVIGFGGRVMGDGEPKYLNSPETLIFDKRRNLFGFNYARSTRADHFILCEGYMDVISMHQAGFTQAVASLGTAFTEEQAVLLKRYTKKILLAYDSDGAGVKAALRAIGILREVGISGRVINMRPYKDPDEFIKNLGTEAFQERIDQAENSFFFEIRMLSEKFDDSDPESRTEFHREIAQKLCNFTEDAERENYLQAVCEKYMIGVDNMRKLVAGYAAAAGGARVIERPKPTSQAKKTDDAGLRAQKMLLTWLTDDPKLYPKVKQYIRVEDFTEEIYRKVAGTLFEDFEAGKFNPSAIIDLFEDEEEQKKAAEILQTNLPETDTTGDRDKAFTDIILSVKKASYEAFTREPVSSVEALQESVRRKKELEELKRNGIRL